MLSGRTAPALLALVLSIPLTGKAFRAQDAQPLPDAGALVHAVRAAAQFDWELQEKFTYLEQRRDVKITKLGKVVVGPLRAFEVQPSAHPGRTWKRLIAVDGKPLDPAELSRRDAEHARHVREQNERERRESAPERARRLQKEAEALREREAILDDALAVYEWTVLNREWLEGAPVFVVRLTPRPEADVETREGRWMKQFDGLLRVAEADHQIATLEMRAIDDVTIGWGIIGRVHEGSRFVFRRRRVHNAWLPSEVIFEASGRTLLFRRFQLRAVTTYSGYRRALQ